MPDFSAKAAPAQHLFSIARKQSKIPNCFVTAAKSLCKRGATRVWNWSARYPARAAVHGTALMLLGSIVSYNLFNNAVQSYQQYRFNSYFSDMNVGGTSGGYQPRPQMQLGMPATYTLSVIQTQPSNTDLKFVAPSVGTAQPILKTTYVPKAVAAPDAGLVSAERAMDVIQLGEIAELLGPRNTLLKLYQRAVDGCVTGTIELSKVQLSYCGQVLDTLGAALERRIDIALDLKAVKASGNRTNMTAARADASVAIDAIYDQVRADISGISAAAATQEKRLTPVAEPDAIMIARGTTLRSQATAQAVTQASHIVHTAQSIIDSNDRLVAQKMVSAPKTNLFKIHQPAAAKPKPTRIAQPVLKRSPTDTKGKLFAASRPVTPAKWTMDWSQHPGGG
jgi:hypothetical protein